MTCKNPPCDNEARYYTKTIGIWALEYCGICDILENGARGMRRQDLPRGAVILLECGRE